MGIYRLAGDCPQLLCRENNGEAHRIRDQKISFAIRGNSEWAGAARTGNEHGISPVSLCCLDEWIE